jgi:hypothetical protein
MNKIGYGQSYRLMAIPTVSHLPARLPIPNLCVDRHQVGLPIGLNLKSAEKNTAVDPEWIFA